MLNHSLTFDAKCHCLNISDASLKAQKSINCFTHLCVTEPIFFWLESKLIQNSSSHGSIPLLIVKLPGTGGDLQGLLDPLHVEDPVPGCSTACSVHRIIQRMEKVLTTKWLNKLSVNYYIDVLVVLVVPILSNMM